jgi:hypothetical protein
MGVRRGLAPDFARGISNVLLGTLGLDLTLLKVRLSIVTRWIYTTRDHLQDAINVAGGGCDMWVLLYR